MNAASISMLSFLLYFGEIGPWAVSSINMDFVVDCNAIPGPGLGQLFRLLSLGSIWKYITACEGAFILLGTGLQYHSTTRGLLLAGKMVNGVGIGAAMATATAYASEVFFFYRIHFDRNRL